MKKIKVKSLLINLAIPLGIGGLSYLCTKDNMNLFDNVVQPPLAPPQWLFPIVWSVLYVLMGIASYLIYEKRDSHEETKTALILYGIQLAFNFFWSILFFNLKWYFIAFLWLIVLWSLIYGCIRAFRPIEKTAAYLLIPYLLWVTFAGYLNLGISLLN